MSPHNAVIIALASAVVLAILLSFAVPRLYPRETPVRFDSVREAALAAAQLREFRLPAPAAVVEEPAELEVAGVGVPASRVRLVWECPSPVYSEDHGAWLLGANGTHAWIESRVYVKDEGGVLRVYFFAKEGGRAVRLSYRIRELLASFTAKGGAVVFDGEEVYRF